MKKRCKSLFEASIPGLPTGPGVYLITNTKNGKVYVGSSVCIRGRCKSHLGMLRKGKHDNGYMQRAFKKYGERWFRVEVLEHCGPSMLVKREQFWVKQLDARNRSKGYNICNPGPRFRLGVSNPPSARKKMSEMLKGIVPWQATNAAAEANRGRKRSAESVEKSRAGLKGQKRTQGQIENIKAGHWRNREDWQEIIERSAAAQRGRKHTEEHKANIGASHWRNREDADEIRAKVGNACRGQRRTPEQRANMSAAKKRTWARKKALEALTSGTGTEN